jgi:hypothetical protein
LTNRYVQKNITTGGKPLDGMDETVLLANFPSSLNGGRFGRLFLALSHGEATA